jgi:drug/metabolite transporter (DMT)-like permease
MEGPAFFSSWAFSSGQGRDGGMTPWFLCALLALLLLGVQRFFYKVAAERGCSTALATLVFMSVVAAASWLLFLSATGPMRWSGAMVLWGAVNGLAFLASAVSTIEALRHLPAGTTYTLTRLSTVFAALFSIVYFHDRLKPSQLIGIVLAAGVILLCAGRKNSLARQPGARFQTGLLLALLAVLAGTVSTVSSKFGALYADKWGFMAVSYTFSSCGSLALRRRELTRKRPARLPTALSLGLGMGLFNLVGYYALLQALASGPLSVIAPLTGMHFFVAIVLSALVYRERPDRRSLAGILLAVLATVLMKR